MKEGRIKMTYTEKETENSFLLRFIQYHVTEQVNSSGLFSRDQHEQIEGF